MLRYSDSPVLCARPPHLITVTYDGLGPLGATSMSESPYNPASSPARILHLDDLRADRGVMDIVDAAEQIIGQAPAPIAVVSNGVVERFFESLKYEHLYRGHIADGNALDMETHRFRIIYNTIRPHQALADRTPKQAYLDRTNQPQNLPTS